MCEYDISFCSCKECNKKDCIRHNSKIPKDIPVSICDFGDDGTEECEYYIPDDVQKVFLCKCKKCGNDNPSMKINFLTMLIGKTEYYVECDECDNMSESAFSTDEAADNWNKMNE